MRWPWTSRARLDDALAVIAEQKVRIERLESDVRRLADRVIIGHGGLPAFSDLPRTKSVQSVQALPVDTMQLEAPTVINEVRKQGARSAREIAAGVESSLIRRHKEATGQIKPHPVVPSAMAKVAAELEAVMSEGQAPSTGNGTH